MEKKGAKKKVVTEHARRFELLLEAYRRADGEVWKGTEIYRATDKTVSSAYVTAMRSGAIKQPSDKYRRAIAQAMGFPFEYWFMDVDELREELRHRAKTSGGPKSRPNTGERRLQEERSGAVSRTTRSLWAAGDELAGLVGDQVAWMMLDRGVGELTDRELSEEIDGRLTEEEIRRMRAGETEKLVEAQVLALSDLFGIEPGYWLAGPPRRDLITPEAAARILRHRAGVLGTTR